METRPPEPNSTASHEPPKAFQEGKFSQEDVTIRRESVNLDELAEAKTVISKSKPGSIPTHPGNSGFAVETSLGKTNFLGCLVSMQKQVLEVPHKYGQGPVTLCCWCWC